jgi:hypothetical protein
VHPGSTTAARTNKMLTRRRLVKHVQRKNSCLLRCARCPRGRRVRHRSSQNSCTITRASLPDTRVADAITAGGTEVELCNLSAPCEWIVGATASPLRRRQDHKPPRPYHYRRHRGQRNWSRGCTKPAVFPDTRVADAITAGGTEVELCNLSARCEWIVGATATASPLRRRQDNKPLRPDHYRRHRGQRN